ncbi:unnamed protein product [Cladocopium goreaui]|uniref:Uncharacterized protein n=1 Tax=Cladocopium goreaui TaxID=2562237 RepID=A0A9P1CGV7_9DINO|nr:unnamed protein product [Cladocopium goreaui]
MTLLDIFQAGRAPHGTSELCVVNRHGASVTVILCDNFGGGQLSWSQLSSGERLCVAMVELEDFDHAEACAGFYPLSQLALRDHHRVYGSSYQGKDIFSIKAWATGHEEYNHEAWTVCFDSFRSLAAARKTQVWIPPGPAVFISGSEQDRKLDVISLQLSMLSTRLELQLPAEAPLSTLVAEISRLGYPNPLIVGPRKQRWTGFGSDPALQCISLRKLLDASGQ